MIRLVTAQDVKHRMIIDPSMLGVTPAIESAITAAHLRVETEYDTRFDRSLVNEDTFLPDPYMHSGVRPGGMYRLYLRNAFVRVAPMTVTTPVAVYAGTDTTDELVDSSAYKLDAMRGIVYLPEVYGGRKIRIVYEAGFADGEKDQAPDWLKESILAYVPVVKNFSSDQADSKLEKMNRQSGDHAMAIIAPYKRNIGFCIRPVY